MDARDRRIVNALHGGFPIAERPYAETAARLDIEEAELIARLERMLEARTLSRFGPLYDAERMGGGLTLAAMQVPEDRFEEVADIVGVDAERIRALALEVARAEGPERLSAEWWHREAAGAQAVRDYFRVEDEDGRRFWLYRSAGDWFLHGLFG